MAWQISIKLPEWTSWTLLVLLACYDLFAVLSPAGPLKMLVELMVEQQSFLPGLLYEADVTYNVTGHQLPENYEMGVMTSSYQVLSPSRSAGLILTDFTVVRKLGRLRRVQQQP